VNGVLAALQPMDVEGATLEIDVEPAKAHCFGHAQTVAVHHQYEEPVASGKGGPAGGIDELADLGRGEVAAGSGRLYTVQTGLLGCGLGQVVELTVDLNRL